MGYLYNHLATVVCGVFAAVLTGLWYIMAPMFPVLDFVFLMAVPIMWFLTATCWVAQKSADYMKKYPSHDTSHDEKKNHNKSEVITQVYTTDGKTGSNDIVEAKTRLNEELNQLKTTIKLKDSEIDRLKQEIANLETLVQIEALKSELANLKVLASEEKSKRKSKT